MSIIVAETLSIKFYSTNTYMNVSPQLPICFDSISLCPSKFCPCLFSPCSFSPFTFLPLHILHVFGLPHILYFFITLLFVSVFFVDIMSFVGVCFIIHLFCSNTFPFLTLRPSHVGPDALGYCLFFFIYFLRTVYGPLS